MTNSKVKTFLKKIEATDVLQLTGLSFLGVGLFLWLGAGVSLSVVGAVLLCIGFFSGAVKVKK